MIFVCNSWLCLALYLLGTGFLGCSTIQEVSGILQPGWIREVWPNHGSWLVAGFFRINHVAGISSNPYGLFKTNNWFGCGHGVGQVSVWSKHDWTLPEIVTDPQYEYCSLANLWNGWAYNVDMPCFKWESKSQLENWTNNFHGNNSRLCIYIYTVPKPLLCTSPKIDVLDSHVGCCFFKHVPCVYGGCLQFSSAGEILDHISGRRCGSNVQVVMDPYKYQLFI